MRRKESKIARFLMLIHTNTQETENGKRKVIHASEHLCPKHFDSTLIEI